MTTYNGWRNYETWAVALWIDNEQGSQEYFQELATEIYRKAEAGDYEWNTKASEAEEQLANAIEAYHDENMPVVSGVYADLLGAALGSVDWREIAEHYIDDIKDEVEAEIAAEQAEETSTDSEA
jgi:ADP-ribosylglycohydrolase